MKRINSLAQKLAGLAPKATINSVWSTHKGQEGVVVLLLLIALLVAAVVVLQVVQGAS
jgi:hypothetical protein